MLKGVQEAQRGAIPSSLKNLKHILTITIQYFGWCSGAVVSTVASQHKGSEVEPPSWFGGCGVCGWGRAFLCRVCMFSLCLRGFSPGTLVRLIDDSKMPVGLNGCLSPCVSPAMN